MNLRGAVTVITGAGRGIGLALARRLLELEGSVVLTDRDAGALDVAMGGLPPGQAIAVAADVRNAVDMDSVAAAAREQFGSLDAWINNAGLAIHKPIVDYQEEELDLMMDVNLKGVVFGCQSALRAMSPCGSGRIVNVVSTAALRGIPTESFYCATKWGLRGFTQALAEEAAPLGIGVTAILPGGVDTGFWDHAVDREMPVGDFLSAAQVAEAIVGVLRQDDDCVTRELVVRSMKDRDFAGR